MVTAKYICMGRNTILRQAPGLFDIDNRLAELTKKGDCLQRLDTLIKWGIFSKVIDPIFGSVNNTASGGRPAYSTELMFKLLVMQRLYNLSDEQAEFQANDRLNYQRFLGVSLADSIPDQNTIREFREALVKAGAFQQLFEIFNKQLREQGLFPKEGSIVDATFVEVPRQRNTREENHEIKNDITPKDWVQNPDKLAQKDLDARWAKKNDEVHFGYKNYIKVNVVSKLIEKACVTAASVHDSQAVCKLVESGDKMMIADSAYSGRPVATQLAAVEVTPAIVAKAPRGGELSEL